MLLAYQRRVGDGHAAVALRLRPVVLELVLLDLDGAAQQEAHVVPELGCVAHARRHQVCQLVDRHKHERVGIAKILRRLLVTDTEDDFLALVHAVRRVLGLGQRLGDAVGVEASLHVFAAGLLLGMPTVHVVNERLERGRDVGKGV